MPLCAFDSRSIATPISGTKSRMDGPIGWQRELLITCLGETQVADAYVLLAATSKWRTQRFDPAELNPPTLIHRHYPLRKPQPTDSCSQLSSVFSPV